MLWSRDLEKYRMLVIKKTIFGAKSIGNKVDLAQP